MSPYYGMLVSQSFLKSILKQLNCSAWF